MKDILTLSLIELENIIKDLGEPKYRAAQVFNFLHKQYVNNFQNMNLLPKSLRAKLEKDFFIPSPNLIKKQVSKDKSEKYLFSYGDDYIETVLIDKTVCVSTQAGCKMGCYFCLSSKEGFKRNLTAGEILSQVYYMPSVSNIVIMGMGEPLDNYNNTLKFIERVQFSLSARSITLSTCGIVPKIYELADKQLQINLAVSLHAASDDVRRVIMPIAQKYTINEILKACKYYFRKTGRRISFEYTLIKGVNENQAPLLAEKLKGFNCHVNIIPLNKGTDFLPASKKDSEKFLKILIDKNINATIRHSKGSDIQAACGQLVYTSD